MLFVPHSDPLQPLGQFGVAWVHTQVLQAWLLTAHTCDHRWLSAWEVQVPPTPATANE